MFRVGRWRLIWRFRGRGDGRGSGVGVTVCSRSQTRYPDKLIYGRNNFLMEYKDYCMQFTNDELEKGIIQELINIPGVKIKRLSESGGLLDKDSSEPIETICFDGDSENIFVNFLGIETDIFVFDKEIMLIDESAKGIYISSDVYQNVVFEGELRKLSHSDILRLITDMIKCFIGAANVDIIEEPVPKSKFYKIYNYYTPLFYTLNVKNGSIKKQQRKFENITINF